MVYYFTSNSVDPPATLYMGKDKVENEELIKYGLDDDICAHVYLRWHDVETTWETLQIPNALLEDCGQLTKHNSIEGNKKNDVGIVYTPWSNLKKDSSMATGQVGFKDQRKVRKFTVERRENAIVNRLNKTKVEKFPDLEREKLDDLRAKRLSEREVHQARQKEEARIAKEHKEKRHQRDHAYDDLHSEKSIAASSNQNRSADYEEDFM